ncbi:hypothetical protein M3O96_05545 [Aquiflexum sp. TKW24L]|uniref:hypothetical protein n=1 Tax=Aquiflexum sp. TKW24L TaxID=2942212 RepID=UPI0020BF76BE|nr:hypothetical protein [Aquiflexum sp. TKW24L]MCL6258541.1 hypothetical protein [Aquiflexum sp. TKW24L]
MKKLSLEMLRLTSDEVLQRSQMKKITGGYGWSVYYCKCISGNDTFNPNAGYFPSMNAAISFTLNRCGGSGGCVLQ